jgi:hypothetical protein
MHRSIPACRYRQSPIRKSRDDAARVSRFLRYVPDRLHPTLLQEPRYETTPIARPSLVGRRVQ